MLPPWNPCRTFPTSHRPGSTHLSAKLPEIALNSQKSPSRTALWSKKRAPTSWSTPRVSTTFFFKKLARVWNTNGTLKYPSTPVQMPQKKHNGHSTFRGSDGSFVRSSRATSNIVIIKVVTPGGHLHKLLPHMKLWCSRFLQPLRWWPHSSTHFSHKPLLLPPMNLVCQQRVKELLQQLFA